jgi:hypothetical protein
MFWTLLSLQRSNGSIFQELRNPSFINRQAQPRVQIRLGTGQNQRGRKIKGVGSLFSPHGPSLSS